MINQVSVDTVLDENANVVERRDYLPYGSERTAKGTVDDDNRFTGKEFDKENGLYYYGARYYDPVLGRFISLDPASPDLTDPQTLNKYSYVLNNPIKYNDPSGNVPKNASILSKFISILSYDSSGKGWLSYSANRYKANPNSQNKSEMINRQSLAFGRFFKNPSAFTDETWDHYTNERIQKLDPRLHVPATDLINKIEEKSGKTFRVSDGYRTFAKQDELYAQGRENAGKVVTNAKGGESYHNYGLAIDIAEITTTGLGKRVDKPVKNIGKALGFEWGGDWGWDYPHFQMTFGKSWKTLLKESKNK